MWETLAAEVYCLGSSILEQPRLAREAARSERWWNAAPPCGSGMRQMHRQATSYGSSAVEIGECEQVGSCATINAVSGSAGYDK